MSKTKKILIAEDDDSIAHLYTVYLETKGYEVVRAEDGQRAIDLLASEKPDLLLLDIMMPQKSGFDVLEETKGDDGKAPLPIIMFTAISQEAEKRKAQEYGVKGYLVKSQVVISDVAEQIEQILA